MSGDFTYNRRIKSDMYGDTYEVYEWEVSINGHVLKGASYSERQAYRQARKAVKRYLRMWNLLNPSK